MDIIVDIVSNIKPENTNPRILNQSQSQDQTQDQDRTQGQDRTQDKVRTQIKSKSDMKCAPGLQYTAESCAKLTVLIEIAKAYNVSAQSSDKIMLSQNHELLNPQKYKQYLVNEITRRVGDKCTTQKCWSTQEFMKNMEAKAYEEFTKYTFRPDSPEGRFEWLSTYNINDTIAQYEENFQGFKFFGAVPMDFADIPYFEVGHIDYAKYYKQGITQIGVIFNLDNHDQPGSHWTAMFTDFKNGNIFYFDSFAVKPERRVRALMRQQTKFLKSLGKNTDSIRIDYNKVQHQHGNNACGVYSINFLVRMARGDDFDTLCNNPISDERMNKCRLVYFDRHIHDEKKSVKQT